MKASRRYLLIGAALVLMSLVLGWFVTSGMTSSVDARVLRAVSLSPKASPGAVAIAKALTTLGDPGIRAIIIALGLAVLIWRRWWRFSLILLVVPTLSIVSHSVAKEVFARPRPTLVPALDDVTSLSYPSGHAAGAMVVLVLGALLLRGQRLVLAAVILALAIGTTRVLLGVHWPSDVLGGWLFGGGAALMGYAFAQDTPRRRTTQGAAKGR